MADYPCAVSHATDDGLRAAIKWCLEGNDEGERVLLWLPGKDDLDDHPVIDEARRAVDFEIVTSRDGRYHADGPVLAYGVTQDHLGDVINGRGITRLAVVTSFLFDTWIRETNSEVLVAPLESARREGGGDTWTTYPVLSLRAADELRAMSRQIDLDHVLTGRDKARIEATIRPLIRQREGVTSLTVMEWAAADGWRGRNFKLLGKLVHDIEGGL